MFPHESQFKLSDPSVYAGTKYTFYYRYYIYIHYMYTYTTCIYGIRHFMSSY
jgi:hypothetical protein